VLLLYVHPQTHQLLVHLQQAWAQFLQRLSLLLLLCWRQLLQTESLQQLQLPPQQTGYGSCAPQQQQQQQQQVMPSCLPWGSLQGCCEV
jgi:hypothetical protein